MRPPRSTSDGPVSSSQTTLILSALLLCMGAFTAMTLMWQGNNGCPVDLDGVGNLRDNRESLYSRDGGQGAGSSTSSASSASPATQVLPGSGSSSSARETPGDSQAISSPNVGSGSSNTVQGEVLAAQVPRPPPRATGDTPVPRVFAAWPLLQTFAYPKTHKFRSKDELKSMILEYVKQPQNSIWDWQVTNLFQEYLYVHQHPPRDTCQSQRYMTWALSSAGIGSSFRTAVYGLAAALNSGRIFIFGDERPYPWLYLDKKTCGNEMHPTCQLQPWSHCKSPTRVVPLKQLGSFKIHGKNPQNVEAGKNCRMYKSDDSLWNTYGTRAKFNMYPAKIAKEIVDAYIGAHPGKAELLTELKWNSWWVAQALAYLMRPSDRLLNHLKQTAVPEIQRAVDSGLCIGMHLREANKATEMHLHGIDEYMKVAQRWRSKTGVSTIVMSFDNPDILQRIESYKAQGWKFYYLDTPRDNKEAAPRAKKWGGGMEYWYSMRNLAYPVQCDYVMGTLKSNWCALQQLDSVMWRRRNEVQNMNRAGNRLRDPYTLQPYW